MRVASMAGASTGAEPGLRPDLQTEGPERERPPSHRVIRSHGGAGHSDPFECLRVLMHGVEVQTATRCGLPVAMNERSGVI